MTEGQVGRLLGLVIAVVAVVVLIRGRPESPRLIQVNPSVAPFGHAARPSTLPPSIAGIAESVALPGGATRHRQPKSFAGPTGADLLYRTAREAMVRGDDARAITVFEHVVRTYPQTRYATSALYYRAFLQYRQYHLGAPAPLRSALTTLRQLRRQYPKAPQLADAQTLETRICGELAKLGDLACRTQLAMAARSLAITIDGNSHSTFGLGDSSGTISTVKSDTSAAVPDSQCHNEEQLDKFVAILSSLWKVDSTQAMQTTGQILAERNPCFTQLRAQALLIVMQRSTPVMAMAPAIFNAARNDPSPNVRQLAKLWLLSQEWEPEVAEFFHSIFGTGFRAKPPV